MTNHEEDFDSPRVILVEQKGAIIDFGLLPKDFKYFGSFQMLCAGLVVRSSENAFELVTSYRSMLPPGMAEEGSKQWQERAISFVNAQWQAYIANDLLLPRYPRQEEAFNEIMSYSSRNLGTEVMCDEEIEVGEALHTRFMRVLDRAMFRPAKGLTGRYGMGGVA